MVVAAGLVEHELPLGQPGDGGADRLRVAARGRGHAIGEPGLVLLGLEAADHPGAGVGDGLVVEVDGVLGGQHQPDAERPGLLEQGQDRLLGRRRAVRRREPGHLVEVHERPQLGGAGLATHPPHQLRQHQAHHELALLVVEVGDGHDGGPGPAVGLSEHGVDVDRRALVPRRERRRGQQPVELEGQLVPIAGGEERVELEHPELAERRCLDLADERAEVERRAGLVRGLDDVRQQDVLAPAERIALDADQGQQPRHRALDLLGNVLRIGRVARDLAQAADEVQRHPGRRARGVDRERGLLAQLGDALGADPPPGQALPPGGGLGRPGPRVSGRLPGRRLDPGLEVLGRQVREREQQVPEVALGVDDQGRDVGQQGLLEQHDAEAGLARARHADDDAVGGERSGIERDVGAGARVRAGIDLLSEEEATGDGRHGRSVATRSSRHPGSLPCPAWGRSTTRTAGPRSTSWSSVRSRTTCSCCAARRPATPRSSMPPTSTTSCSSSASGSACARCSRRTATGTTSRPCRPYATPATRWG